jgi:hypothetical protein
MNKTIESLQKITKEAQVQIKENDEKEFESFIKSNLFSFICDDFRNIAFCEAKDGKGSAELNLYKYFYDNFSGMDEKGISALKVKLSEKVAKALCFEGYRWMQTTINFDKWTIRMSWFENGLKVK